MAKIRRGVPLFSLTHKAANASLSPTTMTLHRHAPLSKITWRSTRSLLNVKYTAPRCASAHQWSRSLSSQRRRRTPGSRTVPHSFLKPRRKCRWSRQSWSPCWSLSSSTKLLIVVLKRLKYQSSWVDQSKSQPSRISQVCPRSSNHFLMRTFQLFITIHHSPAIWLWRRRRR